MFDIVITIDIKCGANSNNCNESSNSNYIEHFY